MELMDQSVMADFGLEEAKVDLARWLLKDDKDGQDFCDGAKETNYLPASGMACLSPSNILMSEDLPDWMEKSNNINWDDDAPFLDGCLSQNFKNYPWTSPLNEISWSDDSKMIDINAKLRTSELQSTSLQENTLNAVEPNSDFSASNVTQICEANSHISPLHVTGDQSFTNFPLPDSPESMCDNFYPSEIPSGTPTSDFEDSSESQNDTQASPNFIGLDNDASEFEHHIPQYPEIITVPLSEAFTESKPVIKTIRVKRVKIPANEIQSVLTAKPITSTQNTEPQRVVINLKRIHRPVQQEPATQVLKDIISDNGDDLLRDLVLPKIEHKPDITFSEPEVAYEDVNDDVEFKVIPATPESVSLSLDEDFSADEGSQPSPGPKRHVPYSLAERKLRKKEQNKRAALRYRQKKKDEESSAIASVTFEEERNKQLKDQYKSLEMEIKLMKKLVKEIYASKS